jgi:hypothetical protein
VTDLGDASRDITHTANVSRSSIAKGRGTEEKRTAADIAAGKTNDNESTIQGITLDNNTNLEQHQQSNAQDSTSKEVVNLELH